METYRTVSVAGASRYLGSATAANAACDVRRLEQAQTSSSRIRGIGWTSKEIS